MGLTLGFPLACYNLMLVERSWNLLLGKGPFLLEYLLSWWEKVLFVAFFFAEICLFILSATALLRWATRPLLGKYARTKKVVVVLVGLSYFAAVTGEYRVLRYFKDGLTLTLIRRLGGGLKASLVYVQDELAGLFSIIVVGLLVILVAGWLLIKFSRPLSSWFCKLWLVRVLSSRKGLLIANGLMILAPILVLLISPNLHGALGFSLAHRLYMAPAAYLSDFDRDGYGFMDRPADFAPFNSALHPYAIEIPGNGIDENGIGGDLPAAIWERTIRPWDPAKLQRKNVLLIVLETARYDLPDARVDGVPVMPTLRTLPGEWISMFSHAGYTTPSITGFLNETLAPEEEGISLIDRFKALGYGTGIFSGQHEGFGDIASLTHMDRADVFFDASMAPREQRMYANTSPGALSVPASVVNARFAEWFKSLDHKRPFFAYINWQEMHFPYYYRGAPTPLVSQPILRREIVPANHEWVRRTYLNGARIVDDALAQVIALLDQAGIRNDTVIVIVGDHGEEFFENGYLGHGVNLSYEENATVCKLINSNWKPPAKPVGCSDMGRIIHNALVNSSQDALPLSDEVLCYVGDALKPGQVGLVTSQGIVRYDFKNNRWTQQSRPGAPLVKTQPLIPVIHRWESFVVKRLAPRLEVQGRNR